MYLYAREIPRRHLLLYDARNHHGCFSPDLTAFRPNAAGKGRCRPSWKITFLPGCDLTDNAGLAVNVQD